MMFMPCLFQFLLVAGIHGLWLNKLEAIFKASIFRYLQARVLVSSLLHDKPQRLKQLRGQ